MLPLCVLLFKGQIQKYKLKTTKSTFFNYIFQNAILIIQLALSLQRMSYFLASNNNEDVQVINQIRAGTAA